MKKISSEHVLKRVKAKARPYTIISVSIDNEALKAFNRACKRHQVKRSKVIAEFMREFAEANG